MSTTTAVNGQPVKNNGGTVLLGGAANVTQRNAAVTNVEGQTVMGAGRKAQPGPVLGNDNAKIVNAGTFGALTEGAYIVKGGNVTTALAGVAYTGLKGGANDIVHSIAHSNIQRRTVLIDSWDYVTGVPTYNAGNPSTDSFGTDYAVMVSRAIPGYLVYLTGDPTPVSDTYDEKTGG